MKTITILILLLTVGFLPPFLPAEKKGAGIEEKEARLNSVQGREKLELLVELAGFYRGGDHRKTVAYSEQGLELLKRFPHLGTECQLLDHLCNTHIALGHVEEARRWSERAVALAKQSGAEGHLANALVNSGKAAIGRFQYPEALTFLRRARDIYLQLDDRRGLGITYLEIGSIYYHGGETGEALEYYMMGLKELETSGQPVDMAEAYSKLGTLYRIVGDPREGQRYYQLALDIFRRKGQLSKEGEVLHHMAYILLLQDEHAKAIEYAKAALRLGNDMGERRRIAKALAMLGVIYMESADYNTAMTYLDQSLQLATQINELEYIAGTLWKMGAIKRLTHDYTGAIPLLRRAIVIAETVDDKPTIIGAASELALAYEAMGDFKQALIFHKKFKQVNDFILTDTQGKKINTLKTTFDLREKDKEIRLLTQETQIQQLKLQRQQNLKNYLAVISLMVIIVAVLIYARYRSKHRHTLALRREIEERKKTRQQLEESEEKFRLLAEKSMAGIYIFSQNTMRYANPALKRIFGLEGSDVTGRNPLEMVHPDDLDMVRENIAKRLTGQEDSAHYQFRAITPQGDTVYLDALGARTIYQGQPAVIGTLIDVTQQKTAQAELIKSHKMEAVGILAGGIAHDFNNLLGIIVGYTDMIKENISADALTLDMVEKVQKASAQASALADKFIAFSKSGWLEPEQLHLNHIFRTTAQHHHEIKHLLNNAVAPTDLHKVYADERRISEVIFNLLKNALESGSKPEEISIHAENTTIPPGKGDNDTLAPGDYVKVSIVDKGEGIPPDLMGKILEPYFTTKTNYSQKGLGLGLAVCYSILKKHGGDLRIESESGTGTTVSFLLPTFMPEEENPPLPE